MILQKINEKNISCTNYLLMIMISYDLITIKLTMIKLLFVIRINIAFVINFKFRIPIFDYKT